MMIEGRIQHILDTLHHSEGHTFWDFDRASGDPWCGYARNGYEITYSQKKNLYFEKYFR